MYRLGQRWRSVLKYWPCLAVVVASLAAGVVAGWTLRGEPPKPDVSTVASSRQEASRQAGKQEEVAAATSSLAVYGPTEVKRHIKRYHPPTISCAPASQTCVCPGPGPLVEEEYTTTTTGYTTVVAGSTINAKKSEQSTGQSLNQQEARSVETYEESTKLDLDALIGAHVTDPTKPLGGAEATWRPSKHVHFGGGLLANKDEAILFAKAGLSL